MKYIQKNTAPESSEVQLKRLTDTMLELNQTVLGLQKIVQQLAHDNDQSKSETNKTKLDIEREGRERIKLKKIIH